MTSRLLALATTSSVLLSTVVTVVDAGVCPKGFGSNAFFPPDWKIPEWPQDLSLGQVSALRTVRLEGFETPELNEEYLEGPNQDFMIQGQESYWQASGDYFMYYCLVLYVLQAVTVPSCVCLVF